MWWGRQGFYARFPICFANLGYCHLPTVCTMPIKLRFPFVPKLVIILTSRNTNYNDFGIFRPDSSLGISGYATKTGSSSGLTLTPSVVLSGQTLNWYSEQSTNLQLNTSSATYHYLALG